MVVFQKSNGLASRSFDFINDDISQKGNLMAYAIRSKREDCLYKQVM